MFDRAPVNAAAKQSGVRRTFPENGKKPARSGLSRILLPSPRSHLSGRRSSAGREYSHFATTVARDPVRELDRNGLSVPLLRRLTKIEWFRGAPTSPLT